MREGILQFLLFLVYYKLSWSYIAQINPIGEVPWIYANVTLIGGESECAPFLAEGTIHSVAMRYYYSSLQEILAQDTDLLVSIAITTPLWEIKECISIGGYNTQYQYCQHDSYWNSSLWSNTNDGGVEGYVDFLPYQMINEDQYWLFCITNGWQGSVTAVHYELSVAFVNSEIAVTGYAPGLSPTLHPTSSPTSVDNPVPTAMPTMTPMPTVEYPNPDTEQFFRIQSDTPCPSLSNLSNIEIIYRIQLSSQQQQCLHVPTSKPLTNITFALSKISVSDNIYSSISDLSLSIRELISSSTIQIGGEYPLSDPDSLKVTLDWPLHWQNIDIYDTQNVTIFIPPISYSTHNWNNNYFSYQLCLVNTYLNVSISPTSSTYSHLPNDKIWYEGSILLSDTPYNCDIDITTTSPTLSPTNIPSSSLFQKLTELSQVDEIFEVSINSTMAGGDSICLEIEISGKLNNISLDLQYIGNELSWVSDILISIQSPPSSRGNTSRCVQFGGVSSNICYDDCDWIGIWPDRLNTISNGHYILTAQAFNSPKYEYGIRQLCISHANHPSDVVTYVGVLSLNGIYHSNPPPTPRIQSTGTTTTGSTLFLISLIIPLTACCCLCVVSLVYRQRKKLIFYHHAGDNDDVIIGQDYTLPDHPSEIYSQQIVDPNVISLQEEGDIFSPQEPPDTDSLQVLRSASFTSTSSASSSFMRLPSFSVPLTAAEKEKKKGSLQFTAPKQYSTPPTSTLSKSQSTLSDEKTESSQQHHLSSRQSSIVSRSSSSSSPSSSPSVQSNKSIKNAPKSLLSQSQSARNENTGSLVEQRRESQRPAPQISLLFERDIFADDYSSHSIPDTRDIELTSLPIDIDERTASSTSLGELILPELQVSLMNDEVETTSIDPDVQRTVSRFLSRANSGVSSTNRPTLSHQSVDTVSSTNSIIDKI